MIAYGSVYGHTENLANVLASRLADLGVKDIAVYDVSATHPSYILAEAFRRSHLVFASVTYNGGIFTNMEHLLLELKAHNLQNRTVAVMENGSWAAQSGKQMKEIFSGMKNMNILEQGRDHQVQPEGRADGGRGGAGPGHCEFHGEGGCLSACRSLNEKRIQDCPARQKKLRNGRRLSACSGAFFCRAVSPDGTE